MIELLTKNALLNYLYILGVLFFEVYIRLFDSKLINEKQVKSMFIFCAPLLIYLIKFDFRKQWIMALVSWWFFALGLFYYFNDINKIPLIYGFVVFYSEFYELPLYFLRCFRNEVIIKTSVFFVILRLSVLIYILYKLNKDNYNWRNYIEHTMKMLFLLIPFTWYGLGMYSTGYDLLLLIKFICFIGLLYYLRKNRR